MSSQGENQNSNDKGVNNNVQPANQQQQQLNQVVQQSQGIPSWNPFNQMISFAPNTMYGLPMMNMISYQLAMQQIQSQNFLRPPNSMIYPIITNGLMGNSVTTANSSTGFNQASARLTDHVSQSSPAATEIYANAKIVASAEPNPDITHDSPPTSKSPETKVYSSNTDKPHSTSIISSNAEQDPAPTPATPELAKPFEDNANLQDEMPNPVNGKSRKCKTQKCEQLGIEGDKNTIDYPYDRPMFSCEVRNCNRKFRVFEHMKRHLACHSEVKNYYCRYCREGFALKFQLASHLKLHDTTKSSSRRRHRKTYDCDFCDKKFSYKARLEKHIMVHMRKIKPNGNGDDGLLEEKRMASSVIEDQFDLRPNYGCRIPGCGKLYSEQREFDAHFKLQHNIDKCPYVCTKQLCGKTFAQKNYLLRHQKTHETKDNHEKKLFPCPSCYKSYSRRDTLRNHLLWNHY